MSNGNSLKLLLVEDSDSDAMLFQENLRSSGIAGLDINLNRVTSLHDAEDFLRRDTADAVLLDLTLPDSSGLDTVNRILEVRGDMPIVVLTGIDDEQTGIETLRMGVQDYLVKGEAGGRPIIRAIRYAIERKRAEIERTRLLAEIGVQRALLQTVFDSVNIGLALLEGPELRYVLVNPVSAAFARDPGMVIGRKVKEVWPESVCGEICQSLDQAYQTGEPVHLTDFPMYLDRGEGVREAFFNLDILPLRGVLSGDNDLLVDPQVTGMLLVSAETTEQVYSRWQIEQSELRFRNAVESFPYGFAIYDARCRYVYLNAWGRTAVRLSWHQVEGRRDEDLFPHALTKDFLPVLQRAVENGAPESFEWIMPPEMGGRTVVVNYVPLLDDNGAVYQVMAVSHDITERRQAEMKLAEDARIAALVNRILEMFVRESGTEMYDKILDILLEAMESGYGVFGYIDENGDLLCPTMSRIFHECEMPGKCIHYKKDEWKGLWGRSMMEMKTQYSNKPPPVPKGHVPIRNNLAAPIVFQGNVIGLLNFANRDAGYAESDITFIESVTKRMAPVLYVWIQKEMRDIERRQREVELKKLNRTLKALGFSSQAMMRAVDERAYLDEVCRIIVDDCGHAMVWIGYAADDEFKTIRPVSWCGFEDGYLETMKLTWADTERGRGPAGTAIRTGKPGICKNMLTDPAFEPWRGEALKRGYASSIALPLMNEGGAFGALTIYSREPDPFSEEEVKLLTEIAGDLSHGISTIRLRIAHEAAETALRDSELRYRTLFDAMNEGFALHEIICDEKGIPVDYRFLDINQAFERSTGLKRANVVGKTSSEVLPGNDPHWLEIYGKVALTGEPAHFDNYAAALERHYEVFAYRPAPGQFAAVFMDITERRQLEAELIKSQKLESVGILAGGIAHDFNNLLTAVLGNISLAKVNAGKADKVSSDKVSSLLEKAESATVRAAELTQRLITFARGGGPVLKPSYINGLIEETVRFSLAGSNLDCRFDLQDDLWPVKIDEGQMRQVFQNIVINAREAAPVGGYIDISARNLDPGDGRELPPGKGRYLMITVRDYGTGIAPENLSRIFDPYYSTKERGTEKGMGLGLSVCYSIIAKHGGTITAESAPGEGTSIHVRLPASRQEPEKQYGRMPRVMIMDDENLITETSGEILREEGFEVVVVRDGARAVEVFSQAREDGKPFDALILDLTIPGGMGGREALRAIRAIDPGVKAVVTSGYIDNPVMANFREHGFSSALPKPFTREMLVDSMSRMTGRLKR